MSINTMQRYDSDYGGSIITIKTLRNLEKTVEMVIERSDGPKVSHELCVI